MKITINIQTKAALTLIVTAVLLISAVTAYAAGQKNVIGHYAKDIWINIDGEDRNIQEVMEEKIKEFTPEIIQGQIPASTKVYRIPLPGDHSLDDCNIMLAANDAHYGAAFEESFYNHDTDNAWRHSHYGGLQSFYELVDDGTFKGWEVTCRYGFNDEEHEKDYRYDPKWKKAYCSYLLICTG